MFLLSLCRRLAEAGIEISGADPSTAAAAMFEAVNENEDDEAALMEVLDADEIEDLAEAEEEAEEEKRERRHKERADDDADDQDEGAETVCMLPAIISTTTGLCRAPISSACIC